MSQMAHNLVHRPGFNRAIFAVILLAGALAGLETSASIRSAHGEWLRLLNGLVLVVFIVEIALKLAAEGRRPWHFFRSGWNIFDLTIVALCCLPMNAQFVAVLRLARALRLLRLVTVLPRLQLLVGALLKSLGAMGYVGLLLALMFYIYGVAGVHLFREIDADHFGSLKVALLSLFQVITLDNWSDIYRAARSGAPVATPIYFISFILLGTMIMLNLFIGIIMNSMSEMHREIEMAEGKPAQPSDSHEELLREIRRLQEKVDALAQRRVAPVESDPPDPWLTAK